MKRWALWLAVATLVTVGIIYVLIWYGPDVIARHDIGNITGPLRALRLLQARDAARGRLLTLGAGLFAAGALVFTALNFQLSRVQSDLSRKSIELTELGQRRTLELTEQGQVTDRYTKAIEQLGSEKLDVRIGAIYALERIARDSGRDHPTVMEVLAAFIREHSHEHPLPGHTTVTSSQEIRSDLQAALTVIGRRNAAYDHRDIDLGSADLTRANLTGARLTGVDFARADLTRADLSGAQLAGVNFTRANLSSADLREANLTGALLAGANLTDAVIADATLNGADLTRADLTNADFIASQLIGVRLAAARLTDANFTGSNLRGVDFIGVSLSGILSDIHLYQQDRASGEVTAWDTPGTSAAVDFASADFLNAKLTDAHWPEESPAPDGWVRDPGSGRLRRAAASTGETGE